MSGKELLISIIFLLGYEFLFKKDAMSCACRPNLPINKFVETIVNPKRFKISLTNECFKFNPDEVLSVSVPNLPGDELFITFYNIHNSPTLADLRSWILSNTSDKRKANFLIETINKKGEVMGSIPIEGYHITYISPLIFSQTTEDENQTYRVHFSK